MLVKVGASISSILLNIHHEHSSESRYYFTIGPEFIEQSDNNDS